MTAQNAALPMELSGSQAQVSWTKGSPISPITGCWLQLLCPHVHPIYTLRFWGSAALVWFSVLLWGFFLLLFSFIGLVFIHFLLVCGFCLFGFCWFFTICFMRFCRGGFVGLFVCWGFVCLGLVLLFLNQRNCIIPQNKCQWHPLPTGSPLGNSRDHVGIWQVQESTSVSTCPDAVGFSCADSQAMGML